jgi:NAD(P)-dependent dehydrogenase (short-subunit alcohol dehydrogenase family)
METSALDRLKDETYLHSQLAPRLGEYLASQTALGRVGLPDDIGGALAKPIGTIIASLLSEDNQWVNAQRIEVSGGQSI